MELLVLHFRKEDDHDKTVQIQDINFIVQQVFHGLEFSSFSNTEQLENLGKLYKAENMTRFELLRVFRNAVVEVFYTNCGMTAYMYQSRDDDEVFCKVACLDEILLAEAEHSHYMVKLNPELENIDIVKENMPYVPYTTGKQRRAYEKEILSDVDRIRLMDKIIRDRVSIEALKKYEILVDMYPLHNKEELGKLKQGLLGLNMKVPVDQIKRYMGEKVALYFSWLNYYKNALGPLALACFAMNVLAKPLKNTIFSGSLDIVFIVFLCIWAIVFQLNWNRKSVYFSLKYGTDGAKNRELIREDFQGKLILNPITKEKELTFPASKKLVRSLLSYSTTFGMIGLVIVLTMSLFIYRAILIARQNVYGPTICAVLNSLQIYIMVIVYDKLAIKLTKWENHKTESDYDNSLIIKRVGYQFINYYISLFYVAFFKQYIEGCDNNNCISELQYNLWIMFLLNMIFNVIEIGLPIVLKRLHLSSEEKKVREMAKLGKITREQMAKSEYESKLSTISLLDEYLELVMNFGYIMFFCVVFPAGPFIYYVFNYLEIKGDAYKFLNLCKRPFPELADNIGVWSDVMSFMCIVAIVTNISLVIFSSDILAYDLSTKWWVFIIIEHSLLFASIMLLSYYPKESKEIRDIKKRQSTLKNIFYYQNVTEDGGIVAYNSNEEIDLTVYFNDNS